MKKLLFGFVLLLLFIGTVAGSVVPSHYNYSKTCNFSITGLTDTPVWFNVYNVTGTDTSSKVYLNNHISQWNNGQPIDIEFGDSSGNSLPFWVEENDNTPTYCAIWVNVTNTSGNVTMYYGNSTMSSLSNGTTTFALYDTFNGASLNTSMWSTSTGTVTLSGGVVTCLNTLTNTAQGIKSANTYGTGTAIRARVQMNQRSANELAYDAWGTNDVTVTCLGAVEDLTTYDGTQVTQQITNSAPGMHVYDLLWVSSSSVKGRMDGLPYGEITTHIPTINLPITLRPWGNPVGSMAADWIVVRKYNSAGDPTPIGWSPEHTTKTDAYSIWEENLIFTRNASNPTLISNTTLYPYENGQI